MMSPAMQGAEQHSEKCCKFPAAEQLESADTVIKTQRAFAFSSSCHSTLEDIRQKSAVSPYNVFFICCFHISLGIMINYSMYLTVCLHYSTVVLN